jgi:alpha-L-arabinofuranosidase
MSSRHHLVTSFLAFVTASAALAADPATLTVQVNQGKAISPDLFGIFFEDLSYAADGGLYAELVENRSFEYSIADKGIKPKPDDVRTWHALTAWELVQRGGGKGSVAVATTTPLNTSNPHYAELTVVQPGDGVGLANDGFDGVTVKAGAHYDVSLFARQLSGTAGALTARLEATDGTVLASVPLAAPGSAWAKIAASLTPTADATHAKLVILASAPGIIAIDMVSLFPQATFKNHPNGLRPDLAQAIADLHPKFMRFPGGCVAHGDGVDNIYRWKDTIGPVETRKGQPNIWRYHQSYGLGYFEYFQFCEDIGAKPLPVLAAGVSCQNSKFAKGTGQEAIPMADMPAYVQDVLDLIEYANGPATSTWGAKRAAAGHPAPFNLQYLGIGNEDKITPAFHERFQMLNAAVKSKHPEITVIGTVGPSSDGEDFEWGWQIARELHVDMVDEHCYKSPQWFLDHLTRYDTYARGQTNVYIGEYAAHDTKRRTTLRAALAEAAYLTQLERNGDVVQLASYAPLMAKYGHISWAPNLMFFDNSRIITTIGYQVQRMFSTNSGSTWMPTTSSDPALKATELAVSAVKDATTGDMIVKLVNNTASPRPVRIAFAGFVPTGSTAALTVLADADLNRENTDRSQTMLVPVATTIPVSATTTYEVPAQSLSVLRFAAKP